MTSIQLLNGKLVSPFELKEDDFEIEDIAHSLSQICRFGGHTKVFYSVAQHSVNVSYFCPSKFEMWGLLHDSAEAFFGIDIPGPIKKVTSFLGFPAWFKEERILEVVAKKFGLIFPLPEEVKIVDSRMLSTEEKQLMKNRYTKYKTFDYKINSWCSEKAKKNFLERYYEIKEKRK